MKHSYLILASALVLASTHMWASSNTDPASGAPAPQAAKPAVKAAPAAPAQVKHQNSDPMQAAAPSQPKAEAPVKAKPAAPVKAQAQVQAPAKAVKPAKAQVKKQEVKEEKPQAQTEAKPAAGSLEEQLKSLDNGSQIPLGANREKLYAVQQRYLPLRWKNEFTFGGASNLTGDNFIRTQQLEAGYHLHINDFWSLALQHAWVDNKLRSDVDGIQTNNGALPVVPYTISRTDLTVEYNVFYGKFRWTAETVSYFDMYMGLGAAQIEQNTGTSTGYVGDLGFAFWMGRWGSTRIGLKDYYYQEQYRTGALWNHNIHAHLDLGYLF